MTLESDFNMISFKELVCYFGRDARTVRKWLKQHEIEPLKPFDDKNVYYCREKINNALKSSTLTE